MREETRSERAGKARGGEEVRGEIHSGRAEKAMPNDSQNLEKQLKP